ncbi:hypothetical protein C8R46DRAFT_1120862 [Mycena filopes]|nr:hypothetical protein C8R46DRAFT_1120862 [Mycena filopes]
MRPAVSGPRQSPPRPASAAPRPLAQLSNPPPSSASVSSTSQPRPQHPHARSSTRGCVTSDSRRSLGSRGVRRQQWASATRSASPWRSRTRRIWPRFRLSLAHAGRRLMLRYFCGSLGLLCLPYDTHFTPPQIPIIHKYLSSTIPTPGLITLAPRYLPHYPLLYRVWYLM